MATTAEEEAELETLDVGEEGGEEYGEGEADDAVRQSRPLTHHSRQEGTQWGFEGGGTSTWPLSHRLASRLAGAGADEERAEDGGG